MPYGGASLAPLGAFESKVPEDLKARVAKREAEIKSGDFQVIRDDSEPRSTL
jgi:hypothetical protein